MGSATALRQVALSMGDEFMPDCGVLYDASTDTYVRLRRTATLSFTGTPRKQHAHIGGVTITWLAAEQPDLRSQLINWWLNRKEP